MAGRRNQGERWDPMAGAHGRRRVSEVVGSDPDGALAIARNIEHPWYRCQALSEVASWLKDRSRASAVIRESLDAAMQTAEPNRIVSVSAWPLKVLLGYGGVTEFETQVERLLAILLTEPNPVRRQDAAAILVWHIPRMPEAALRAILAVFEAACKESVGWKASYNLRNMAQLVDARDHEKAVELALMCRSMRDRRRALRAIGELELAERYYEASHP